MDIKANPHHILMSDTLKGTVPEFESDTVSEMRDKYIHVVADRRISGQQVPLVGLLRTVMFGESPEVEMKVEISDAIATIKAEQLFFEVFTFQHGDDDLLLPGPFTVSAARIQEIDPITQTCILALGLQRIVKKR